MCIYTCIILYSYKKYNEYILYRNIKYNKCCQFHNVNYNENIIRFYTKQTAKPFGYRQMHRYTCGYDADIKVEGTKLNLNGYCKDASYAGIAFICKDEDKKLRHGQKLNATVTFKDLKFKNLKGKIVRIEENYFGETSLIGINFVSKTLQKLFVIIKVYSFFSFDSCINPQ